MSRQWLSETARDRRARAFPAALAALMFLNGCGGDQATGDVATAGTIGLEKVHSDTGASRRSTPTPTPTPTDAGAGATSAQVALLQSPTLAGAADLVLPFPVEQGLHKSWGTGAIPGVYSPDEGAFRFTCGGEGKLAYEDPVVFPGQPGKSHLHQPWGNVDFTAWTTPATLAASAKTNCNYGDFPLNRSLYWMPALIDDQGQVRQPDLISVYYKRGTPNSPACTPGSGRTMGICTGLPNQIRFIFGWDYTRPTAPVTGASWYCTSGDGKHHPDLDAVFNSGCVADGKSQIIANTGAPHCWDGANLDSPDHRSHMAWATYGSWGYLKCPATHPYVIPREENKATWTVTPDMIGTNTDGTHYSRIKLSSDHMLPGAKPGQTLHADYMEAWDSRAKAMWVANCIEKGLNCSGGDLGNGLQLNGASMPAYGWVNPSSRLAMP